MTMISRGRVTMVLVTLGLYCACVGAGVLRHRAEPTASRATPSSTMPSPSSSNTPAQGTGSGTSGTESGSGQVTLQPEQSGSKNTTEAPEYSCPQPWSGNNWTGNTRKTFDVVDVPSTRTVCSDVPIEEKKCYLRLLSPPSRCFADFSKCISCHTVVTGKRTVCKEELIVLQELRPTDRRHLNDDLGYFTPVPSGQEHYPTRTEVVWQLQAMEGHRVYLELSQIDLRNEDGKCSDHIEISFNPCTPPTKICDNRVNSYTWATTQTQVQVRFVSDNKHTSGIGFRGAYYYYPVNTSNPLEDALKVLRTTNSPTRRRRRAVLKQLYTNGMLTESQAGSSGVTHRTRSQSETLPLTSRRMSCISDILQSGKATNYISDPQCRQLATVFHTQGFYSP